MDKQAKIALNKFQQQSLEQTMEQIIQSKSKKKPGHERNNLKLELNTMGPQIVQQKAQKIK